MIEDRQLQVLLDQAEAQRRLGNHRGAIELVQRALTLDPDHAVAHAALASALLAARRLPGAALEVRLALALDGHEPYIHLTAAAVLAAQRKLGDALGHCLVALESLPASPEAHVLCARILALQGDRARAREMLEAALGIEPADTAALTALASLEHASGDREAARRWIAAALESDPADLDAHVVAGEIELVAGDAVAAERHARFVLGQDATHADGLQLWVAIQARRSRLLGAWWRWNMWASLRDERSRIALLIGMFVVARIAIIVTDELGLDALSRALGVAWLACCAYSWFAPVLFQRMLARSLGTVKLDPDF